MIKLFRYSSSLRTIGALCLVSVVIYLFNYHKAHSLVHQSDTPKDTHVNSFEGQRTPNTLNGIPVEYTVKDPNFSLYQSDKDYWRNKDTYTTQTNEIGPKMVIFDCGRNLMNSYELINLNQSPKGWKVMVINMKDQGRLKRICPNCLGFEDNPEALNILHAIQKDFTGSNSFQANDDVVNKMAAVMYSIKIKNSPWIFMTNKAKPIPFGTLENIVNVQSQRETSIFYMGPNPVFQPCSHFMDPFTWKGHVHYTDQNRYEMTELPRLSLFQIVDGCNRPDIKTEWRKAMDTQVPTPFVKPGTVAPIDFDNIIVPREAVWTLVASMTTKPMRSQNNNQTITRVSTNLLSLLVQRVIWDIKGGVGLAFVPGELDRASDNCHTCIMEHELSKMLKDNFKTPLHKLSICGNGNLSKADKLDSDVHALQCLQELVFDMRVSPLKSVSSVDINNVLKTITLWRKAIATSKQWISIDPSIKVNIKQFEQKMYGNPLYFTAAKSPSPKMFQTVPDKHLDLLDICGSKGVKYIPQTAACRPEHLKDVVVIIIFNSNSHLENIVPLEILHGRYFKHIVYCSEGGLKPFEDYYMKKHNQNPVTYIDVTIEKGLYGPRCMSAVMSMNFNNVVGYFQFSDDVIINTWNFNNVPLNRPWFQRDYRVGNLASKKVFGKAYRWVEGWWCWTQPNGQKAVKNSMALLKSHVNNKKHGHRVSWFLNNLKWATSCDNCVAYYDADIYYVPAYMADEYKYFLSNYFSKVYLEIAVPTLLSGITPQSDLNIYRLRGFHLVQGERLMYEHTYMFEDLFLHPVKFTELVSPKGKLFFCNIMRKIDEDVAKNIQGTCNKKL